jgi:hypothetical protein
MAKVRKQTKDFNDGMSELINQEGIAAVRHFDVSYNQLKPYRDLATSTATGYDEIHKFVKVKSADVYLASGNILFCLANVDTVTRPAVLKWNNTLYKWEAYQAFDENGVFASVLHYYNGYFYGLWLGTHLWRVKGGEITDDHKALTYTNYSDFITHSKDNLVYIPTDNVVRTYDGTDLAVGITLPATFIITSIAEQGDYIMIVGYDSITDKSIGYLWDRDSTLATLTAKYDLGEARVAHNATLGGTPFVVSVENSTTGSPASTQNYLAIGYIDGDKYTLLRKFPFRSITLGAKYATGDNLYFIASLVFNTDAAGAESQGVLFRLDYKGRLFIEQTLPVAISGNSTGAIRNGDAFWIGAGSNGGYHSASTSANECALETNRYKSDDMSKSLSLVGAVITFDPLPTAGRVKLYYRVDADTTWTELADFTEDSSVKGSVNGAVQGKTIQFKISSTGNAVINGFQADFEEISDEVYG